MFWLSANAMLKARIVKKRREITVNVSLELNNGGSLGLFGASGAGKSTILACLAGIEETDDGYVKLGDLQIFSPSLPFHKKPLGYLTQEPGLFPHLRVSENVTFGIPNELTTDKEHFRWIETLRDRLQLGTLWNAPASLLSGDTTRHVSSAAPSDRKTS